MYLESGVGSFEQPTEIPHISIQLIQPLTTRGHAHFPARVLGITFACTTLTDTDEQHDHHSHQEPRGELVLAQQLLEFCLLHRTLDAGVSVACREGIARLKRIVAADVVFQQPLSEHDARETIAIGAYHNQLLLGRLRCSARGKGEGSRALLVEIKARDLAKVRCKRCVKATSRHVGCTLGCLGIREEREHARDALLSHVRSPLGELGRACRRNCTVHSLHWSTRDSCEVIFRAWLLQRILEINLR
mmetsp:Transcript_34488/g.73589  ORF Transcript_34488/g.73589 Transcript_34488/m.73589 type:complete len:246 (-) Transcript_34488:184-921(-)